MDNAAGRNFISKLVAVLLNKSGNENNRHYRGIKLAFYH